MASRWGWLVTGAAALLGVGLIAVFGWPAVGVSLGDRAALAQVLVEILGFGAAIWAIRYVALEFEASQRQPDLRISLDADRQQESLDLTQGLDVEQMMVPLFVRNVGDRDCTHIVVELSFDRQTAEDLGLTGFNPDRIDAPSGGTWGLMEGWPLVWGYRFTGGEDLIAFRGGHGELMGRIRFRVDPGIDYSSPTGYRGDYRVRGRGAGETAGTLTIAVSSEEAAAEPG